MTNTISTKPKADYSVIYAAVAEGLGPIGARSPQGDTMQTAPLCNSRLLAARAGQATAHLVPQPKTVPWKPTVPAFDRAPTGSIPRALNLEALELDGPGNPPAGAPRPDDDVIAPATPIEEPAPAAPGPHVHFAEVAPTPSPVGTTPAVVAPPPFDAPPDYSPEHTPDGWHVSAEEVFPTPTSELSAAGLAPQAAPAPQTRSQRWQNIKDDLKVAVRSATAKPRARLQRLAFIFRKQN